MMDEPPDKGDLIKTLSFIALIITSLFITFLLVTRYATIDDFFFFDLLGAMHVEKTGHIDSGIDPFPGFTILCVTLSKILGLKYETIIALPLLAPLFIFILVVIAKKITSSRIVPSLIIMGTILLYFGSNPNLFCHTVGLALWLVLAYISYKRVELYREGNPPGYQSTIVLVILIVAINIISYKLMFLTIFFLIALEILMRLDSIFRRKAASDEGRRSPNTRRNRQFIPIILIGSVLALSFNWFFYNAFIPAIASSSGHPFEGIMGLFMIFSASQTDSLSPYLFVANMNNAPLYILLYLLTIIPLLLCLMMIIIKIVKRQTLTIQELFVASISVTGSIILLIYSSMGFQELSYLLIAGIFGYSILLVSKSKWRKIVFAACVSTLLILTIIMSVLAVANNSYGGQTDQNEFQYLNAPYEWYTEYRSANMNPIYSDQLTGGYFSMKSFLENKSYIAGPFTKADILYILESKVDPSINSTTDLSKDYVMNYREPSLVIEGWSRIKPWTDYSGNISLNANLKMVYSSGYIHVCIS